MAEALVEQNRLSRRRGPSLREDSLSDEEFEALYAAAYPVVYRYVLARLHGDHETTADVVQETFAAAYTTLVGGVEQRSSNLPLLFTIAHRRLVDHFRLTRRRRVADERAWERSVEMTEYPQRIEALEALSNLPKRWQEVLLLRYVADLSVRDVARVLGRSERSTESLLARARRAFRKSFESGSIANE
jgi:RNA polymerase sigma-70 factor (ECF subfamily)